VLMDFDGVQASFFYSTQTHDYQRMQFHGTKGRIEVEIPFNAPSDRPTRLLVSENTSAGVGTDRWLELPVRSIWNRSRHVCGGDIEWQPAGHAARRCARKYASDRRRVPLGSIGRVGENPGPLRCRAGASAAGQLQDADLRARIKSVARP